MRPFIRRVTIRNYKSIAACRVELNGLSFLVGLNGAGKSNFLDALRFIADALRNSLDHALRERGTIKDVRRRSGGHPNHFALKVDFTLPDGRDGHYSFKVGAKPQGSYEVQDEECVVYPIDAIGQEDYFRVQSGRIIMSSVNPMPSFVPDRLMLVAASGFPEFRPVYDALSSIEVYNLNPREISAIQAPDHSEILRRYGGNAASVFQQLTPEAKSLIKDDLSRIVPGLLDAETKNFGQVETIEFKQAVKGQSHPWAFLAPSMSDGTLRAFGILLAVFQVTSLKPEGRRPLLIGLEEPETALHPAAAGVLLSALRKGAQYCQIIVTSHSPELLDDINITADELLAVANDEGVSHIGPIDDGSRNILRDKLCTPGELLKQSQLQPSPNSIKDVNHERQLNLFELPKKKPFTMDDI